MQPNEPSEADALLESVRETLQRNPRATYTDASAGWRAHRGVAIDDAEAERLREIYDREASTRSGATLAFGVAKGERRRPVWLVGALTFVYLGIYPVVWFGATWSEIKRERNDPDMHPWWHALSILVPIYGLFQAHAHFDKINEVLTYEGLPPKLHPGPAVVGGLIAGVLSGVGGYQGYLSTVGGNLGYDLFAALAGGLLMALVFVHVQAGLNAYWAVLPGRAVPFRVHWAEWAALVLGVLLLGVLLLVRVGLPRAIAA